MAAFAPDALGLTKGPERNLYARQYRLSGISRWQSASAGVSLQRTVQVLVLEQAARPKHRTIKRKQIPSPLESCSRESVFYSAAGVRTRRAGLTLPAPSEL